MNSNLTGKPSIDRPWLKYYTKEEKNTEIPKMSAYEYLYHQNKKYLGRVALSYFDREITFNELFSKIEDTAKALEAYGINKGDIVSISLPNIPEVVYLFYAISKIGAIANMIDPRTSSEGIKNYVKEVNSDLLIVIDSYYNKVNTFVDDNLVKNIVAVSPAESLPFGLNLGYKAKEFIEELKDPSKKVVLNKDTLTWKKFMNNGKNYLGNTHIEYLPNRPLVIEHTGGTTGFAKGVILSNDNINSVAIQSVLTGIQMKREETWLDIMPTFIAYGVGMGLHLPLTIGMKTYLIPQFDAHKFGDLVYKYKANHMVFVPSYWESIINNKKLQNEDLSFIIAPTVGGDAMDPTLEKKANQFLKEHNCSSQVVKGYGMTEVCGGVSGTSERNNHEGSVGIPFVKTIISVFDPDTNEELSYNQEGEICMTGPNIMLGYYNNEEETKKVLRKHEDGRIWVHSGDIGYMKEDGSVYIVDRVKRMIIRYDGFKIFPSLIEKVISSHEAVESCKVVGIKDPEHAQGKLPKVHIVIRPEYIGNEKIIESQLRKLCATNLPEYVQPVDYKFRDVLPLTPIGKIDYRALEREDSLTGPVLTLKR